MVPKVELPLVTVFTVQVTVVFVVPVTTATMGKLLPTVRLVVLVEGVVMEIATPLAIVTLTEADLEASAWLVALISNVAGDGTAPGARYVTDRPEPVIIPNVELPLVMPFTVQVTAVFVVFDTEAVMGSVVLTSSVWAVVGLLMAIATGSVIDTATDADLVLSATLVAVRLNVAGDGTEAGAV